MHRLPVLLAVLLSGACLDRARSGGSDPVILRLDENVVRRSEYDLHLAVLQARGAAIDAALRERVLQPFLEQRVLVLEARNRGLVRPGDGADAEEAAVRRLLGETVLRDMAIRDEEIAAYFETHRAELAEPETFTLGQVLLPTAEDAEQVHHLLARAPEQFEEVARERSRGPEAVRGGQMGTFSRGQLIPELEEAALRLAPGAISEVVKTGLGYHVLRLVTRTPGRAADRAAVEQKIRAELARQKSDIGVRRFVSGLLARAKVDHAAATVPAPAS